MPYYFIILGIIILVALFIWKIVSNIKRKSPKIYPIDATRIVQISMGVSVCLDFLRIVLISQIGLELEFFKPYTIHLMYTIGFLFYLSYNNFIDLKLF